MRISYEPQDIQDMARLVAQELMPLLLAEIREAAKRQPPPPPLSRPESPKTETRPATVGAVVNKKGLKALTGLSPSTVARMEEKGLFPRRVTLSPGRVGWMRDAIEAWRETRAVA